MQVILISGKAQHGKDTVANLLKQKLLQNDKRVLITHYADLLKYICRQYFDWDGQKDERGRRLLQYVGTDVIRKKNPHLWADFIITILSYFGDNWDYVIIPDCRFPNEVTSIKTYFDAVHIKVTRPRFKSALTPEQLSHPSETALDDFEPDVQVINDGNLVELEKKIDTLIKEILNG